MATETSAPVPEPQSLDAGTEYVVLQKTKDAMGTVEASRVWSEVGKASGRSAGRRNPRGRRETPRGRAEGSVRRCTRPVVEARHGQRARRENVGDRVMTGAIVASGMAVLGFTGLVLWHGYSLRRERQATEARLAVKTQARLALVKELYPLRQVDTAYADALESAGSLDAEPPYDQAAVLAAAMDTAYGKSA